MHAGGPPVISLSSATDSSRFLHRGMSIGGGCALDVVVQLLWCETLGDLVDTIFKFNLVCNCVCWIKLNIRSWKIGSALICIRAGEGKLRGILNKLRDWLLVKVTFAVGNRWTTIRRGLPVFLRHNDPVPLPILCLNETLCLSFCTRYVFSVVKDDSAIQRRILLNRRRLPRTRSSPLFSSIYPK